MAESNVDVDSVSGNEIPPGSTAEGVRDTVDAKLSVGEFVIPTNVVNYLGIKYFDNLIAKAEESLNEMAEGGRTSADLEEDDLPFSDEELETAEDTGEPIRMAEGGLVTGEQQGEQVQFSNGTETIEITFVNGKPITVIPPGFVQSGSDKSWFYRDDPVGGKADSPSTEPFDPTTLKASEFQDILGQQKITKGLRTAALAMGPAGMPIAGLIRFAEKDTMKKSILEIDRRLALPDLSTKDRDLLTQAKTDFATASEKKGILSGGVMGLLRGKNEDGTPKENRGLIGVVDDMTGGALGLDDGLVTQAKEALKDKGVGVDPLEKHLEDKKKEETAEEAVAADSSSSSDSVSGTGTSVKLTSSMEKDEYGDPISGT